MDGRTWLLMGGLLAIVLVGARGRSQSDFVNKTFDIAGLAVLAVAILVGVLWPSS